MPRPDPEEFHRRAMELARLREKPVRQIAADLGIAPSVLHRWLRQADVDEGMLLAGWQDLIEDFPTRFLAGIDVNEPGEYDRYDDWVAELLNALAVLPEEVQRQVTVDNAERLLGR